MRFKIIDKQKGWRLRFAIIPFKIDKEIIWLEKYWSRFEGLYTNVRTFNDKPF